MTKFQKSVSRLSVGCMALFAALSAWANLSIKITASSATASSGAGKVYAQYACSYSNGVDVAYSLPEPGDDCFYTNEYTTAMTESINGGDDDTRRFDVYLYARPNAGSTFEGWYGEDGCTTLLSTDNPYVIYKHGYTSPTYYAKFSGAYEGPETFTGQDADDPKNWFVAANWSENVVPRVVAVSPTIPGGKSVVYDPVGAGESDVAIGALTIGTADGTGAGELKLASGTLTGATSDYGLIVGDAGAGRFIQTGGTYTQQGDVRVSRNEGGAGEMFIRGGTFALRQNKYWDTWYANPIHLGESAAGALEVSGTATDSLGTLDLEDGVEIGNASTMRVATNGVAYLNYIQSANASSTGTLVLDGGTLRYRSGPHNGDDRSLGFVSGLAGVYLGAGGATVDDNGATVAIRTAISPDPALAGAACGTLVKTGTGTLMLPALGEGVSVRVDEGAIGLAADEAFTADQLTFPAGSVGACVLDLYGHTLTLSAFGKVTKFVNTASAPATLIVNAADEVDLRALAFEGDIKLVKRGEGRLLLKNTGLASLDVDSGAVQLTVGYRYYKVKCDQVRGWCGYADGWAMSELKLFNGEEPVPVTAAMLSFAATTVGGVTYRADCGPDKLFDGDCETYLMDLRAQSSGQDLLPVYPRIDGGDYDSIDDCWFTIDFGAATRVTGYTWYCGPEATAKGTVNGTIYNTNDPVRMRICGSDDGVTWTELSYAEFADKGGDSSSRSTNESPVEGGSVAYATAADAVGLDALAVAAGATLSVVGADVSVKTLETAAEAAIDLNGASFVTTAADAELKGELNSSVTVESGKTAVGGLWYRFTILRVGWDGLSPILAEFNLYDADGNRINAGLADCGDAVAPRDMPCGSCSQAAAYPLESSAEGPASLFDGKCTTDDVTVWHPRSNVPDDWSAPVTVIMRLSAGSAPAVSHGLVVQQGNYEGETNFWQTPHCWKLEASTDGTTWTTLYSPETSEYYLTHGEKFMVDDADLGDYKEIAYANAVTELPAGPNLFGSDFSVTVDAGATLLVTRSESAIPALVYDWTAGGGTIDGFNPAPNGALYLENVPAGTKSTGALDLTLANAVNAQNLRHWSVYVNGARKYVSVRLEDGRLTLHPGGFCVIIR